MTALPRYWVALWLAVYMAVCVYYPEPDPAPVDTWCQGLPASYGSDC